MSWKKILAQGFATSSDLLEYLNLPTSLGSKSAEKLFRTRVPKGFAARMEKGNPSDPLLLQALALEEELLQIEDYSRDPLQEISANPLQGLIHKYEGRVLLTLTGTCAINCRFCFRRAFPYQDNNPGRDGWQAVLGYIKNHENIHEVILSGGDPLLAADEVFAELLSALAAIKHVKTVRMHTRIPVVLPERIVESFLKILKNLPLRKVIVLHCNHAQEIDEKVTEACQHLLQAGCVLLNQTVLLKGINNNVEVLTNLSEKLLDNKVLPYYLHLLDKVVGTSHFDIPLEEALALFKQLQQRLPGYLVPRLVREEAGKLSKTLVC